MADVNAKSMARAEEYAAFAKGAGWEPVIVTEGDLITCTTTRGDEAIMVRWKGSGFELGTATYTVGSQTSPLRNPSMARQKMSSEPGAAKIVTRPKGRKVLDDDDEGSVRRAKKPLPFDPKTSMDEEVFKALGGKRITWYNHHTKVVESATVAINPGQKLFKMDVKGDRRIFTFVSMKGPFRSIYIDAILEVK